jgi:hypothetical protein
MPNATPDGAKRRHTETEQSNDKGDNERGQGKEPHVLKSSDFPLVVKLVIESALNVGIHGSRRLGS